MSPSQFNTKKEINNNAMYQSHILKINRDSHFIRKTMSSSLPSPCTSSSTSSVSVSEPTLASKPPPRQPVIIYTRPPKVIHTNPNDFMALVQKLTGLSQPVGNPNPNPKKEPNDEVIGSEDLNKGIPKAANSNESESSAVTEESCPSAILDDVQINSCFPPTPIFDPNINHCFNNIPMFMPNEYFCSSQPFFNNYSDPLLLMPNRRSIISPPTDFEALKELREF